MTKINPTTLFVHKKSVDSFLYKQIKKAHPNAIEEIITTNTRLEKPEYDLISIDPKKRGLQKKTILGFNS